MPPSPADPARPRTARRRILVASALAAATVAALADAGPATALPLSGPPVGRLDSVTTSFGNARLAGWTIDPDARGAIRVGITRDGQLVRTVTADLYRSALARAYPFFGGRHGFLATVPVPNGWHRLCAVARNVRAGHDTVLGCRAVTGRNDPVGSFASATHTAAGVAVTGWALDPDTTAAVRLWASLDGAFATTFTAAGPAALPAGWGGYGARHGFAVTVPAGPAAHTVCLTAVNTGAGSNRSLGCRSVPAIATVPAAPASVTATAVTASAITVQWTPPADDGGAAVTGYRVAVDGGAPRALAATATTFTATGLPPGTSHAIGVAAVNAVGAGPVTAVQASTSVTTPSAPTGLAATATASSVSVRWQAPASTGGAAVTGYQVGITGGAVQTLAATATGTTFTGLSAATGYSVTVRAGNSAGYGPAATITVSTAAAIPPQTTPAPVSTSHYLRNLTGVASHDVPLLRTMGATDAGYNPSGHRYLVLQDIGAQSGSGVLLSATTKWVSYSALVAALKAYVDGYASTQKANAPMLLAIGTNNDGAVSSGTGAAWATSVVDPVRAYAARYPNITVVGADDIEPGFSATVTASRSWLSGYLGATTAGFVFNGSADGCPTGSGTICNNGWTTRDLQWLSGGAAPARILALPQIYNTAMPKQWHLISAQGTQRLAFAGPLTEWTACDQAGGGCYSATNVSAWTMLFDALNADTRTAVSELPYGTDLRIN